MRSWSPVESGRHDGQLHLGRFISNRERGCCGFRGPISSTGSGLSPRSIPTAISRSPETSRHTILRASHWKATFWFIAIQVFKHRQGPAWILQVENMDPERRPFISQERRCGLKGRDFLFSLCNSLTEDTWATGLLALDFPCVKMREDEVQLPLGDGTKVAQWMFSTLLS